MATNSSSLIAARAVHGIGAAVVVPNSLALLNHAYPEEKARGWAVGIWAAGASLALTAGPLSNTSLSPEIFPPLADGEIIILWQRRTPLGGSVAHASFGRLVCLPCATRWGWPEQLW
jgi:MFS family permease